MSAPLVGRTLTAPRRDWIHPLIAIVLLGAVGMLAGLQYVAPDKRVLQVAVAALVFGIAWRLDTLSAIGLAVLTLPFPRATTFGNTNLAFLLLIALIWLLRARQDPAHGPQRTPIDLPIAGMLICFVLSFYNVARQDYGPAFAYMFAFAACILMFYLIVSNVRTTADLKRLHVFQVISIAVIATLGVYEMRFPGAVIVPGWITLLGSQPQEGMNLHNARIGSVFGDFELLAEWAAMSLLFGVFLLVRATSVARRALMVGLILTLLLVMFATVTRGAIVALGAGTIYLVWTLRRRINFVQIVILAVATAFLLAVANHVIATYTHAGDLFLRLLDPASVQFEGIMPEARAGLWVSAFNRILEHPFIGHGPHYVIERGIDVWFWPHNGYLYVGHMIGFVGLFFYLLMLYVLWRASRPARPDLADPSYARGFLVIANAQLVVFLIDQLKIDCLRNPIYAYQVWLLFASIVAAYGIVRREQVPPSAFPR